MDLFELLVREHERIAQSLARCIETAQSSRLTGADTAAVRLLGEYLDAQARALYPALIVVSPDEAEEPVMRHHRMSVHALSALSHCRREQCDASAAMRMLKRAWDGHGQYEQSTLRPLLQSTLTDVELGRLCGAMQLELMARQFAAGHGDGGGDGRSRPRRIWTWLVQRVTRTKPRAVPTLEEAVFVYRG